jgi:hypothetical protein
MKLLAAVLAVPAFALIFAATSYPGLVFGLTMLLGVLAVAWRGRRIARGADSLFNPSPRRHRVFPFVALALVAGGCRPAAPPLAPEPIAALAEVETLDCGAQACAVTEVGGATMITVLE